MADALLILRTPFQAWVAKQAIKAEGITNYDLIYITQQDSMEDRYYFNDLSSGAKAAKYVNVPPQSYDILNHLRFRSELREYFRNLKYKTVVLASIDSFVINSITTKQKDARIITVDDGTANINSSTHYRDLELNTRQKIYSKIFGAQPISSIKKKIHRHYTIYPGFDNIVDESRLRYLSGWDNITIQENELDNITYFIGQPLPKDISKSTIDSIMNYVSGFKIDFYVKHPRETAPLDLGVPFLQKNGLIAEDAILNNAAGRRIHIVSGFSTATLNLSSIAKSKNIFVLPYKNANIAQSMEEVARKFNCNIYRIYD